MKYLITLKPIENYFFGGEVTLGEGSKQNYFVKSNLLPQASAVLGLVRYEILRQHGLLSYDASDDKVKEEVCRLIGERGFDLENPAATYGIIQSLSPVFLTDGQEFYTPMPLDQGYPVRIDKNIRCFFTEPTDEGKEQDAKGLPIIEGYDGKSYSNYKYWCNTRGEYSEETSSFFKFSEQIGITKNKKKENEKDAFFKQQLVQLTSHLCMTFTVETTHPLEEGSYILPWGGNRSMFRVTICSTDIDFTELFAPLHRDGRLFALGDAYLEETARKTTTQSAVADILSADNYQYEACREKSDFIWGENKPFRHIINSVHQKHNWNKPNKAVALYHLQSRGSVIYGSRDYLDNLKKKNPWNTIGLNIFI